MMKILCRLLGGVLWLGIVLTGSSSCRAGHQTSPGRMAVVITTLNNPWFVVCAETAVAEAHALGYEAVVFDSQFDPSKEAEHFDNIIAAGYDAILFSPTDADGSIANTVRAMQAGIPVFCMCCEINDPSACVTQILSDSYSGCIEVGKYFAKTMNGRCKYVEILGQAGDNNTWTRTKGFHSVVDCYEGLEMLAQQSGEFDQNKSMEVMESLMQAHPDIDAVFCGNDVMAMGAYQAILAAGKTDRIKVFGFDGSDDAVQGIREGKIEATAMQFPKTMAETAARLADRYIRGERDFPKQLPVVVELVYPGNVSRYGHFGRLE